MKRRVTLLIIIILAVILTGCTKDDVVKQYYTFQGENDSWIGTYIEDGETVFTEEEGTLKSESWSDYYFEIEYKGELSDLEDVKHMEISYTIGQRSGNRVTDYGDNDSISTKTFSMKSGGSSSYSYAKDEVVQVVVNLDGMEENFVLSLKGGE